MPERDAIVAVLAGGRGSRLGGAKAAAPLRGAPLISYPLRAASAAGLDAVVVAKRESPLPPLRAQIVYEPDSPQHPLCGVVCAIEHARALEPAAAAVVVVACDMPFLTGELLLWLASLDGAAVAQVDGRAQPALCRCLLEHLPALRASLAAGDSLGAALAALPARILDERALGRFGCPARLCFNVNSREDLAGAERWLSAQARPDGPPPGATAQAKGASVPRSSR